MNFLAREGSSESKGNGLLRKIVFLVIIILVKVSELNFEQNNAMSIYFFIGKHELIFIDKTIICLVILLGTY